MNRWASKCSFAPTGESDEIVLERAQVRAWQESASRSEVISTLSQAGVLVRLGEALVSEGQEFSQPFDTPGRPARDLVGRIR